MTRQIWNFLRECEKRGANPIVLRGGRRASKTWTACQFLLLKMLQDGDTVIFASMTADQSSAGVYEDCKNIIVGEAGFAQRFEILKSPRRITCTTAAGMRYGKGVFRSYKDPETAKGGACDWVFINEANKFTLQQYNDLAANARKGVICDFNPNTHFWIEDIAKPENELLVRWQWNKANLTAAQLQWFEDIYERAHRDGATAADLYYYKVYYLGEYAELQGDIFTPNNIRICKPDEVPNDLDMCIIFSDPSARVGNDYHATVMAAFCKRLSMIYILDTDSRNIGDDYEMAMMLQAWSRRRDRVKVYIETNGLGEGFFRYCRSFNMPIMPYCSNAKKERRIMDNYHTITSRVVFVETDHLQPYLEQVYTFAGEDGKCEHDDNIDAVNSAVTIFKPYIDYSVRV